MCLFVLIAAAGLFAGCGKKGPPLAPLVKLPVAPPDVAVRRTGTVAALQLRIPGTNNDNTSPANIESVEVYAFTGTAPTPAEVVKYGTLVASIPVRRVESEEESGESGDGGGKPRPPASMANGFDQGDVVTVTEVLGDAQAKPVEVKRRGRQPAPDAGDVWQPQINPPAKPGAVRLYFAVGVNRKGQRGPFTAAQAVPLGPGPAAPMTPSATYDEKGIELTWWPSPDMPRPIQAAPAEGELASTPRGERSVDGGYNVYDAPSPRSGEAASPSALVEPGGVGQPLNDTLLAVPAFNDPRVEFGRERCFVVRSVLKQGGDVTESVPSEPVCITPADTFPPESPKSLATVASEGAISLIWEASAAPDLVGYVVLRRDPAGGFQAVTPEPIKDTTFRDATAAPGVRYVYTVVAVDAAGNRSAPSNAAGETAR